MGQGEEVKTRPDPKVEIQERGDIFFFYRPKIGKMEAHGADDVQKMYIVLRPESGERPLEEKQSPDSGKEGKTRSKENKENDNGDADKEKPEGGHGAEEVNIEKQMLLRFIVMGRKSLPDPSQRSRPYWGFVEMVTTKTEDIKTALKGEEYDTSTRGHRQQAPASALAEGVYRILRHQFGRQTHTHLIYKLEFPTEDKHNEPQEELNIEHEGSFIIQIRNPEESGHSSGFGGLQSKRRAAFPASLQGCLGKRRFAAADPPDFLNYEGCEFLLISASDDIDRELGLDLKTESEGEEETAESCSDLIKLFGDSASSKPLFSGTWV
ncbi:uncharacterized protein LOC110105338 isoform X2 [Dendrobium catenatum]|uniref:uncharacterized protein LOC110105338 isoform X2 n=2 Tax=Dendrobium catenatum TaxID=906689 RepID=UPI0009F56B46|nr:uncharacterized protein LOC110105338 isoform X2 [Dendrobium catenatum]